MNSEFKADLLESKTKLQKINNEGMFRWHKHQILIIFQDLY